MRKSALLAVSLALGAGASSFAACVSNNDTGVPTVDAGGFDFDSSVPGFDGASPSVDGAPTPGIDSTVPPSPGPDAGDASTPSIDSGNDGGAADAGSADAADGAVADAAVEYTDALAPSSWSAFDPATLDAGLGSYSGGTFDGRYAYFAPYQSAGKAGIVARLDTEQSFTSPGAWETFNTLSTLSGAGQYGGATFDGRYVYMVPWANNVTAGNDQTFIRYDTHGGFTTPSSWSQFDGSSVVTGPFIGATFDGRFVYYASRFYSSVPMYDTTQPFTSQSAWSTFDTSTLNPPEPNTGALVFAGAIFDGKYVNFIGKIMARHDTTAPADAGASSWETYEPELPNDAGAYGGSFGGFDGRYLYVLSRSNDVVLRYDTQAPFNAGTSWTTFDVATAGGGTGGYFGANFDGRYLYLVPNGTVVATYDTTAPFGATTSWRTFDTSTVATVPIGYQTSVYDGQNLYVTSSSSTPILRLEVKSGPGPLPNLPQWHGSFL
jgi:hypothetical protein